MFFESGDFSMTWRNFGTVILITPIWAEYFRGFQCVDRRKCVIYHLLVRYYREIAVAEEDQPCVRT